VFRVRVDGGVSNNGFLMQLISNLTSRTLDRPEHVDMTSLGAAFLAGLAVGMTNCHIERCFSVDVIYKHTPHFYAVNRS